MELPPLLIAPRLPTLIFLNGPAGSGKTTLAEALVARDPDAVTQYHHASPLWAMMDCLTSIDPETDAENWKDYNDPEVKAAPIPFAGPRLPDLIPTYRDALISLGQWSRDTFGPWALARLAVTATREYLTSGFSTVVFPACRTMEDIELLAAVAGPKNCLLVRLFRDGHSFASDLGDYIPENYLRLPTVDLHNSGTVEDLLLAFDNFFVDHS
jgi:hypothetical protein